MSAPTYKLLYSGNQGFLIDRMSPLIDRGEAKQNLRFQIDLPKPSVGLILVIIFALGWGGLFLWTSVYITYASLVSIAGNLASPELLMKLGSIFGVFGLLFSIIPFVWGVSIWITVYRTIMLWILTEDGVYQRLIAQSKIQSASVTSVEPYGGNQRMIRFRSHDRDKTRIENGKFITASTAELQVSDRIMVITYKKFYVVI